VRCRASLRTIVLLVTVLAASGTALGGATTPESAVSKIHPRLRALLSTSGPSPHRPWIERDASGCLHVLLEVTESTPALRARLGALGCRIERGRGAMVQAWLPVDALVTVAALPEVRRIVPIDHVAPGGTLTAGAWPDRAEAARLAAVRDRLGTRGAGVRVGVISIGARGLAASQHAGHLPPHVMVRSFRSDGAIDPAGPGGAEGTAELEIVHAIAPDARLSFAAVDTSLELLDAVEAMASEVDVLVSDIIVHTAFPDGRSMTATAVAEVLNRAGTRLSLFVQPAGNLARVHYTSRYRASDHGDEQGRFHEFRRDAATRGPATPAAWNRLSVPPAATVTVFLTWDRSDPRAEYHLLLVDCASGDPIERRPEARAGSAEPPDFAWFENPSRTASADVCYAIRRTSSAPGAAVLNVTVLDPTGRAWQRFVSPGRSLLPPADARATMVVIGAVPLARPDRIEPFSSRGPTFDGRHRPDLVAPDRLPVSGSGGFEPTFSGTSAAAGFMGGVAALLRAGVPTLDAARLRGVFTSTATPLGGGIQRADVGSQRVDVYGAGRVDVVRAAEAAMTAPVVD